MLASENILHKGNNLTYSLTPTGEFLLIVQEYSLRDAVLMLTNEILWRPIGDVTELVQGKPIFEKLYGSSFYDYWKDNVREDHDFQAGMSAFPESGERTKEEFKVLLDNADLKINKIIKSDSYNTILEVVRK